MKKEVSQIVYLPGRKSRLNLFIFRNQCTPHVNRIGFLYTMNHSSQCIHCCFTCIPLTFSILNRNISLFFIATIKLEQLKIFHILFLFNRIQKSEWILINKVSISKMMVYNVLIISQRFPHAIFTCLKSNPIYESKTFSSIVNNKLIWQFLMHKIFIFT